jgi:hypothetical protein
MQMHVHSAELDEAVCRTGSAALDELGGIGVAELVIECARQVGKLTRPVLTVVDANQLSRTMAEAVIAATIGSSALRVLALRRATHVVSVAASGGTWTANRIAADALAWSGLLTLGLPVATRLRLWIAR